MTPAEVSGFADILSAPTSSERVARLRDEGLADEVGLAWLGDRVEELLHSDPETAESLALLAADAAREAGLPGVRARVVYYRARLCAERGDLEQALALIGTARSAWMAAGDDLQALRTDLGRMQILDDLGRHGEAVEVGEALLVLLDHHAVGETDADLLGTVRAAALGNVGVAYSFIGEHQESLRAYAASEAAYAELGMLVQVAQQRANRGIELLALGRAREAQGTLLAAHDDFRESGDRLWAAKCAVHLADAHAQLGELVDALRVLESARSELHDLGASAEEARVHLQLSRVQITAGLFSEAIVAANEAIRRTSAAGMAHDEAFSWLTLASAHLASGHLPDAEVHVRTAADLFDRVGDKQYQARALLMQAQVALAAGSESAPELLGLAAEALESGGWQIPLAWARLWQAQVATSAGERSMRLSETAALIEDLSSPALRYALGTRQARHLAEAGKPDQALTLLRDVIDAVDMLGSDLPDPVLRTAFRADKLSAHDLLVDLLVQRGSPGDLVEALNVGDGAKAKTLTDVVAGTLGSTTGSRGFATEAARKLASIQSDLSAAYGALHEATDPARRMHVATRARELEAEITNLRLQRAVSTDLPEEASSEPDADAGALASLARPALVFHVTGDDIIAFVVGHGSASATRLVGATPRTERLLDQLVAQWSRFRVSNRFVQRNQHLLQAATVRVLAELYDVLVEPVRAQLDELATDSLMVVPHRKLHRVPFHALHDGIDHLLATWSLTVAPTLAGQGAPETPSSVDELLVIAAPDSSSPMILDEAEALAKLVPGARVASASSATSSALRAGVPGPSHVHLACHGLYRPDNPLFSALKLADRWVTCADVLELDLGGALVTLSSCESGRPSQDTAEPVGLAWAFLAAGASGAVVSQWLVDDAVAVDLMTEMYRNLAAGLAPADSLRRAQLAVAQHHPHPYHWAPFVYVASPGSTSRSTS